MTAEVKFNRKWENNEVLDCGSKFLQKMEELLAAQWLYMSKCCLSLCVAYNWQLYTMPKSIEGSRIDRSEEKQTFQVPWEEQIFSQIGACMRPFSRTTPFLPIKHRRRQISEMLKKVNFEITLRSIHNKFQPNRSVHAFVAAISNVNVQILMLKC